MTDAARTPTTPATGLSIPAQALTLLRQIRDAENKDGVPAGGVTLTYTPTAITGTFTFPVERIPTPEGETVRVVDFVK
jgi:hypothetical protein